MTRVENKMDLTRLTDESVRKAIAALQNKDKNAWYACFADKAVFTKNDQPADFKDYFDIAFEYGAHFMDLEKVEEDGRYVFGNYFSGKWGIFRVYFRFYKNESDKFDRLELKQIGLTLNESWHQQSFEI